MKRFFTHGTSVKIKILNCFCAAIFIVLFCTNANGQTLVHPGTAFNQADLNQLKVNITKEPWLSAYNAFKNDSRSKLTYVPVLKSSILDLLINSKPCLLCLLG